MSVRVYKTLKNGDNNQMVNALQRALPAWAWNTPVSITAIDGNYGRNTTDAVCNYQKQMGLQADGIAGIETLQSLGLWADVVRGIDVSDYQKNIDWDQVYHGGISFAIIKASEGATWKSSQFANHYKGAASEGMLVGAYHYAKIGDNDSYDEFSNFIDVIGDRPLSGPIALDLEGNFNTSGEEALYFTQCWLSHALQHFKKMPYVYTSKRIVSSLAGAKGLEKYPLWTPGYTQQPLNINPWKQWNIWQYTNEGMVSGVNGYVDMNYMVV